MLKGQTRIALHRFRAEPSRPDARASSSPEEPFNAIVDIVPVWRDAKRFIAMMKGLCPVPAARNASVRTSPCRGRTAIDARSAVAASAPARQRERQRRLTPYTTVQDAGRPRTSNLVAPTGGSDYAASTAGTNTRSKIASAAPLCRTIPHHPAHAARTRHPIATASTTAMRSRPISAGHAGRPSASSSPALLQCI